MPRIEARQPLRLLTAVPICDGHDSAINTINLEFIRAGYEVIYLGYHRSARDMVRAAIQEDVRAMGISSYNGGHVEFFGDVVKQLRARGAGDIGVFGGGGGTITHDDASLMTRRGVDRIFFAGTPLTEMVQWVGETYGSTTRKTGARTDNGRTDEDRTLARMLTKAETATLSPVPRGEGRGEGRNVRRRRSPLGPSPYPSPLSTGERAPERASPLVVGVTGPGGAGKTTLIDELVLRLLRAHPRGRIAVLSHDPSVVGNGALLGDRATMVYSQDDRVFMRSLASRGQAGGLAGGTERCLRVLRDSRRFHAIIVETVGIGQEAMPFTKGLVDRSVLVMSPDYGARLQLQKIVMLDAADVVVVNKSDVAGAQTAANEIEHRLAMNGRDQRLIRTVAKRHRDAGVDELFDIVMRNPADGEGDRVGSAVRTATRSKRQGRPARRTLRKRSPA